MIEFIKSIITESMKLVQNLLPDRNSNTISWVIRMFVLFWILLTLMGSVYYLLVSTTLGAKYGVTPIASPELPKLSHLELALSSRQTWVQLTQLREDNDAIKGAFLVMLYDRKSGNFIIKPNFDNSDILIWEWSIPDERYTTLEIVEESMNTAKPKYIEGLKNKNTCITSTLGDNSLAILKRGIPDLKITHASICPIYTRSKGLLIGAVVVYFKPDSVNTTQFIEDKTRRTTNLIATHFKDFTTRYEFIYD